MGGPSLGLAPEKYWGKYALWRTRLQEARRKTPCPKCSKNNAVEYFYHAGIGPRVVDLSKKRGQCVAFRKVADRVEAAERPLLFPRGKAMYRCGSDVTPEILFWVLALASALPVFLVLVLVQVSEYSFPLWNVLGVS